MVLAKITDWHEFTVRDVIKDKFEVKVQVKLVACQIPKTGLHGPASSISLKSVIYPCSNNQCRVDCPSQLCRNKSPLCNKNRGKKA